VKKGVRGREKKGVIFHVYPCGLSPCSSAPLDTRHRREKKGGKGRESNLSITTSVISPTRRGREEKKETDDNFDDSTDVPARGRWYRARARGREERRKKKKRASSFSPSTFFFSSPALRAARGLDGASDPPAVEKEGGEKDR